MSDEKGARVVTDGPTTPPPAPQTPSASAQAPVRDRAWAVDRLRILISQTVFSEELTKAHDAYRRGEPHDVTMSRRLANLIAEKCGDDKVLIDAMEASLIPGLRDVNDELAKSGKVLCFWMNGNRLSSLDLQSVG